MKVVAAGARGMRNFIHECLHTAKTVEPGGELIPGIPTGKYYSEISCAEYVLDGPAFAKEIDKEIFLGSAECRMAPSVRDADATQADLPDPGQAEAHHLH